MITTAGRLAEEGNVTMTGQGFLIPMWPILALAVAIGVAVYVRKRRP